MGAIRITGMKNFISDIPVKEELQKLTLKELTLIALRHPIGLKEILVDFIMTKKKI